LILLQRVLCLGRGTRLVLLGQVHKRLLDLQQLFSRATPAGEFLTD
jgi:hypothetical protein